MLESSLASECEGLRSHLGPSWWIGEAGISENALLSVLTAVFVVLLVLGLGGVAEAIDRSCFALCGPRSISLLPRLPGAYGIEDMLERGLSHM